MVALAYGWRRSGNKLAPCFAKENLREVNVLFHLRQELKERVSYCRDVGSDVYDDISDHTIHHFDNKTVRCQQCLKHITGISNTEMSLEVLQYVESY